MKSSKAIQRSWALIGSVVALIGAGLSAPAAADEIWYLPTSYYVPTWTTVSTVPTAYRITSGSEVTTSVALPTYTETAYYSDPVTIYPTGVLTTVYERGLFRRRISVVERPVYSLYPAAGYVTTSYVLPRRARAVWAPTVYLPTVYELSSPLPTAYTVTSSSVCDDQVRTASSSAAAQEENLEPVAKPPVRSEPRKDEGTISSKVGGPEPPAANPPPQAKKGDAGSPPGVPSAGPRQQSTARPSGTSGTEGMLTPISPATKPAPTTADKKGQPAMPAAPGDAQDEFEFQNVPLDEKTPQRHEVQKPVLSTPELPRDRRGVLLGSVETEKGDARENVQVTAVSRDQPGLVVSRSTDAVGRFALRLADGQWTVSVTMPSGREYPLRDVLVKNGRIMDVRENRDIPHLVITY